MRVKLYRGTIFVVFLATGPLAVLAHGLFNAGSVFTGSLIAGSTVTLLLMGDWRSFSFDVCDALFALLVFCIALSVVAHGIGPDRKEFYLLVLSLAAYLAARTIPHSLLNRGFFLTAGAIVTAGAVATAIALATQWNHPHGKPFVFGYFSAAPAQFTFVLGFLVISLATFATTAKRALVISSVIALPAMIFAASMVRFAFVAIVAGLAVVAVATPRKERKFVAIIICAIIACVAAGTLARWNTAAIFLHYAGVVSTPPGTDALGPYTKSQRSLRRLLHGVVRMSINITRLRSGSICIRNLSVRSSKLVLAGAGSTASTKFPAQEQTFTTPSCRPRSTSDGSQALR